LRETDDSAIFSLKSRAWVDSVLKKARPVVPDLA